jgi:hypothetical protein
MNSKGKKGYLLMLLAFCLGINTAMAQDITITINANMDKKAVSPYIYGCNNSFDKPIQFYKDAGLRMSRMNGGNNATKYNWRKKISSHPDWYNNVYTNDWDKTSQNIAANHPDMKVMWAFQLLGRVASSNQYNFDDWAYNNSNWWQGVGQNLAGGGVPNEADPEGAALVEGDIELYTEIWPADSTVAILNHWFGAEGLGLDKNQFQYWNMDNEPDIWNGTHNDVMSNGQLPSVEFMDRFIEVAKQARALTPEIKICGPVTTSEWQWYKWADESIKIDGKYYCWFEYFIKRCADEEKASGIRVLDVFDIHHYPYAPADANALQNNRIFYDKTYIYPGANGLKTINGGWDESQKKEYVFQRINDWLTSYYGENHGITLGLSEWSPGPNEPNLASVIYATHLGTFANNGVEYFTPWNWFTGMWESLHLFSRYAHNYSVSSISSVENTVSAYTTVNEAADSMTVIIVNRDQSSAKSVTVTLNDFSLEDGLYMTIGLSSLPSAETFKSHTDNALKEGSVNVNSNAFTLTVPALSTTAVLFPSTGVVGINENGNRINDFLIYPNPSSSQLFVTLNSSTAKYVEITINDLGGRKIQSTNKYFDGISPITLDSSAIPDGIYVLSLKTGNSVSNKKFTVIK